MARISVSSEADVVEVMRAARDGKRTLEIVGAGTKRGFGRPMDCDDTLDLSGLRGVVKYEPDELVITARAGTPVADIEAALAEKNQRLGFEPADWGPLFGAPANCATIGGVISANANGSAVIRYGRCRDHLVGFHAVNGFGEAYKAGGRVVKNVTGFDLPKLFCGAMGTLGPLTEVTLRVFPRATVEWVIGVKDLTAARGIDLMRSTLASPIAPTALCYIPTITDTYIPPGTPPYFPELGGFGAGAVLVRIDGAGAALAEKRAALRNFAGDFRCSDIPGDAVLKRIDCGKMFESSLLDVWRFDVPATEVVRLIEKMQPVIWAADWAGSRIFAATTPGSHGQYAHARATEFGGRALLFKASDETRKRAQVFAPETPVRAALTQRIKAAFDPLHLFNPGRMWEGV